MGVILAASTHPVAVGRVLFELPTALKRLVCWALSITMGFAIIARSQLRRTAPETFRCRAVLPRFVPALLAPLLPVTVSQSVGRDMNQL